MASGWLRPIQVGGCGLAQKDFSVGDWERMVVAGGG